MEALSWIGLFTGILLVSVFVRSYLNRDDGAEEITSLKPSAPLIVPESQEAVHARVRMSAEIASIISRLEEIEDHLDRVAKATVDDFKKLSIDVEKYKESVEVVMSRVSYQSGAVDQIKTSIKALEERPSAVPKAIRLNLVHYDGKDLKRAKKLRPAIKSEEVK